MVLAGTGSQTVSLYDKGLPGTTIGAGFNYTLFVATGTTSFSRFTGVPVGSPPALNVVVDGVGGDCLTTIAHVVASSP